MRYTQSSMMEFEASFLDWSNLKYLKELTGSNASALQYLIESEQISTLDEVIKFSHILEMIEKNDRWMPNSDYIKFIVKKQYPSQC